MTSRVTADDLTRVDALLARFESNAGGSHLAMCEAAGAIALVGGSGGPKEVLTAMQQGLSTDDMLRAPWQWLLAVATESARNQNWMLTARIAWFARFWSEDVLPTMDRGELLETGLSGAPDDIRAELAALASDLLSTVDPETVIARDATGAVLTAGAVATVCGQELARAAERGAPETPAPPVVAQRKPGETAPATGFAPASEYEPASEAAADVSQPLPAAHRGGGPASDDSAVSVTDLATGSVGLVNIGPLFAKDSSTAERMRAARDFFATVRARVSAGTGSVVQSTDVLAERSAQMLAELVRRLPIRDADTLRSLYGDDPEIQSRNVITEAGRLAGLVWTAAAAMPGLPPVVQTIKVMAHSVIEIRMIGELFEIYAPGESRDANWLSTLLLSWAIGQPVAPGGSVTSTTALLIAKIRGAAMDLANNGGRGTTLANRGRDGTDAMMRSGARMQRRMRLHPSCWIQPERRSAGAVVLEEVADLAGKQLAGKVAGALVRAARDRLAPAAPPVLSQPEQPPASDPQEALGRAWALHHQAAAAATVSPPSGPARDRLTAALAAQERHLQDLGRRLGLAQPSRPSQPVSGGNTDAAYLTWQAEDAIDVVEELGGRSRRLPSWSSRRRAGLVYAITALAVSALPAAGLMSASGFGMAALLIAQVIALPWLSLAAGAIILGPLFRPWLGGPVPRHPVFGACIVFAMHLGLGVCATLAAALT